MTRLAEVRIAPAEPLSDIAAELALELDKVGPVDFTVCCAETKLLGGTLGADELLWLELLRCCLGRDTILHATKVGYLAFEALIVGEFE